MGECRFFINKILTCAFKTHKGNSMRNVFVALSFFAFSALFAQEQAPTPLPEVALKNLIGEVVKTSEFQNDGKPIILSFWATWCKPCIRELTNIQDLYEDWQDETGVKIIAVSIDDARNAMKVAPFVNGQGWDYEIYLDENSEFRRQLNVNNIPHTFLLNGKGEIVWQHNGYVDGDEENLIALVRKLIAGLPLDAH
jgi:cytochrome c biogenesis protein CcmG, thiol:disulfide interchange protein DsbE